jgi:glycosyltransferase involved in cell wall biosynthesis
MRILQVLGSSTGGIARHVAQLTEGMRRRGLEISVAGPPDLPIEIEGGVIPLRLPPPRSMLGHSKAKRSIAALIEGYDLIHAHGIRAGIDASLAARSADVPVVTTVHNLVHKEISGSMRARLHGYGEPLLARASNHIIAVSQDIADHLRARSPRHARKIEVVHLGIGPTPAVRRDRHEMRAELGIPTGGRLVVTASRLTRQKAVHFAVEAVALLPDVHFVVLGVGPFEGELRERALSLGIAERVRFMGFVSNPADYIAAADAFCLSSIWEGVPLAAQEAILLGIPIVATAVGGMTELIADRESGRLVHAKDPEALARAIGETLEDPKRAQRMAKKARDHLEQEFSTARMLERISAIYAEVARA